MATTKKKGTKKKASTSRKTTRKTTVKKHAKKISASEKKEMLTHITDVTQKQLKRIGEKTTSLKDKEISVLKDLAKKIRLFANDATELTKIKIDIHNLKHEHDALLKVMGENLYNMHKSKKVKDVDRKFKYDFEKLSALEKKISEKEELISGLSAELGSIE